MYIYNIVAKEFKRINRMRSTSKSSGPIPQGIVDQSVLLYAGDAIDNTLGVALGLPTLAAAASQPYY